MKNNGGSLLLYCEISKVGRSRLKGRVQVQGQQALNLREFCIEIGLKPVRLHTLRACFATLLISDGVEPIKLMKVCGWRDLKTMARYVRPAGIEEPGITDKIKLL